MNSLKSESFCYLRMRPNTKSSQGETSKCSESVRRKLQYKTEEENTEDKKEDKSDRSVLSSLNLNSIDTRKALRNGADKLTKTFNSMCTSIGTFSQKFKISTKRRQILEEGPATPMPNTPHSTARQVLGRTPTKLYSPFGIDSPYQPTTYNKENIPRALN